MTPGVVLAFFGASALIIWMLWPTPQQPVGVSTPLPPAPAAKDKPTETIQVKTVVVYRDRPVPLPTAKPTERVTATGRLDAEERPYTLSATLDVETGQSRIWSQPEPQPWLAVTRHGEAGVSYGYKSGEPVFRLSARQDLLQVKAMRLGLSSTLDSDGDWFAGAELKYRW
jgi:hypothetical protein